MSDTTKQDWEEEVTADLDYSEFEVVWVTDGYYARDRDTVVKKMSEQVRED